VVNDAWEAAGARGEVKVLEEIRLVSKELASWSREIIGDLQKRIKHVKAKLEEDRKGFVTEASLWKEQVLCYRMERVEEQWDTHWKQRVQSHGCKMVIGTPLILIRWHRMGKNTIQ
jgi:ribosome-binding ATPase YchF (GTP1/OBG family)